MNESQMQRGQQWLETLLAKAGIPAQVTAEIKQIAPDLESCWLTMDHPTLDPEQVQILTGTDGEVLDSVQYLVNTVLNLGQPPEQQAAYTIELNGYRAARQAELLRMAIEVAQDVQQTGVEQELCSLSAAERRQVHTFLKSYQDLETESRGREPDRRLVVRRKEF